MKRLTEIHSARLVAIISGALEKYTFAKSKSEKVEPEDLKLDRKSMEYCAQDILGQMRELEKELEGVKK